MRQEIKTISPEEAKRMLASNKVNRKLNPRRTKQYAYDMKNMKWQLNGEAIKFYADGSLADGQHRLSAIIYANCPVTTLVVYDLPMDVTVQDRGRNRNLTDSMILEGIDKGLANNTIVAIAKLHFDIQDACYGGNVSDGQVKAFIERNASKLGTILSIAPKGGGNKTNRIKVRNAPTLLACFYAFNCGECDINTLHDFLEVLHTGIPKNLSQNAALVCRNDIQSNVILFKAGTSDRKIAEARIEKAIYDFSHKYKRIKTYESWEKPIYSAHIKNKEA